MNRTLKNILIFASGTVAGFLTAKILYKTKYEKQYQEEIKSVREIYGRKTEEKVEPKEKFHEPNYTHYNREKDELDIPPTPEDELGYVEDGIKMLTDSEFADVDDEEYDVETLFYYEDDVLASGEPGEISTIIDSDSELQDFILHISDYFGDTIYVMDQNKKVVYEICRDLSNFYEENNEVVDDG